MAGGEEPLAIAGDGQHTFAVEAAAPVLYVLRYIDDHGAGAARTRDLERRAHRRLEQGRVGDEEDVLGDRAHDGGDRRLLERIRADRSGRHLTTDDDHRDGVGHRVAHRRHSVGGAWPGGDQTDTDSSTRTRIPRRHETRALFIGRDDQRHLRRTPLDLLLVVPEDGVVGRQDGAARVAEDRRRALVRQHLHDHLGAGHDLTGPRMGG